VVNSENRRVLREVARLVDAARERVPAYASRRHVPAGTWHIADLARSLGCHLSYQPLPPGVEGMVLPPLAGTIGIALSAAGLVEPDFGARHELCHVVAEEIQSPVFMDRDAMSFSERVCDMFALADLIAIEEVRRCRRGRTLWEALEELDTYVRSWAPGWPDERVRDRALLRMILFRTHGI
jgi:hypothetical protein